ncbi:MAG: phosphoenolpyruvate-protein phosphotransferase PtsI [Buchnera aphidicola (Periphyllus lyropictus)]|uniref:phosphoenolpyruvate-protein phosphotransferase PtsI n=1 Tax=Buchnera aphidicola TaxID=9 RepID=UPI001ED073FE|nr:phosphoenolpyruvate-protein phosphotransferase PtsI [Buchnera aphidicola]NIH16758.1 phosphoenolpyruvate-protein phosphotransferase PtsI [Buchnera aphidicola (Periphyllus lyropictus)]USS94817.1 phosphoenolpyruvate-protein phosphotransferase PtsI [Buchnera aphidicola (Periphyllus lyropictus)]
MISGISVSPGIVFGKALLFKEKKIIINKEKITKKNISKEIKKFFKARKKSEKQIQEIIIQAKKKFGKKKSEIFKSHILLLKDEELEKEILSLIKKKLIKADYAVEKIIKKQIYLLEKLKDEYLKNRAIDIRDIGNRLLKNILKIKIIDLNNIKKKRILIVKDLTPSQTTQMNLNKIIGFITDLGGKTSHTSIIARSLEIPAIVGTKNITKKIKNQDFLILDSINNKITINPSKKNIKKFKKKEKIFLKKQKKNILTKNLKAITIDKKKIKIGSNISNCNDIVSLKKYGAECVGLYRTEFLFMERNNLPSEEEQFKNYKSIAKKLNGKTIIIRTMDIGGDKNLSYIKFPKEENPFLGWRAIRISIDNINILQDQLKAILRASAYGKFKIMFPMIISIEEIRYLKSQIKKIKIQFKNKKIKFDKNIELGIMIETPASAIISKYLAKEVDFFSIGTNDLTQYTLAVDRGNDYISHLYQPLSPSVLYLINKVIKSSHKEGKWTGICGELASNEKSIALLIGMGIDELSMSSVSIPIIKKIIRKINFKKAKKLAKKILKQSTTKKVKKLIKKFNKKENLLS